MGAPVINLLGQVAVRPGEDDAVVAGAALGGRRARVLLTALALADRPVSGERLAELLWPQGAPATWRVALRGVVLGIRSALTPLGLDGQRLIVTAPSGYHLAEGVRSEVRIAADLVTEAEALTRRGKHSRAADLAEPATRLRGEDLLPGEDGPWLDEHRRAVDACRLRGLIVLAEAAGLAGEHRRAITAAESAVAQTPLDEQAHRGLIRALDRAGDRAGAVTAYERCRVALAEQLGIDPSRETAEVYLAALREESPVRASGRVPAEEGSFVARTASSRALDDALSTPGLVTLTGRGGVGKSRLAQRAALGTEAFRGVAYWVALGAVRDDALVGSVLASALGVQVGASDPVTAVTALLAPLGRALLVLDGCESARDGAATVIGELLARSPGLTVLATSRLELGVPGERAVRLEPFPVPDADPLALEGNPAVALLRERVREGGGELRIDPETAVLVAEVCARCGGLPLALELAAAQLTDMSLGDLLDHLGGPAHEDQLLLVLLRSVGLLDAREAALFRRLSVFDAPTELGLIKQVVCDVHLPAVRVVRLLSQLTAHGLLDSDTTRPYWRYQQDDDIRRLAGGILDAAGETRPTYARLADAIRALLPPDPRESPAPFEARLTDALGAVRSLLAASAAGRADLDDGLEIAFRLHRYWAASNVSEGRFWLRRLLSVEREAARWTALATFALGYLGYWAGDAQQAYVDLEHAVHLLDAQENGYRARALIYLAGLADDMDRGEQAVDFVREAMGAAADQGPDLRVAAAMGLGCVLSERGDPQAAQYAAEAIELCRAHGTIEQLAASLPTAAMVAWQVGDLTGARAHIDEAAPHLKGSRRIARVVLLSASAGLALAEGRIPDAVRDAGIAAQDAAELGVERELPLPRTLLALALLAADDLGGAIEHARAAIHAAQELSYEFPLAGCLEAAVLIAREAGTAQPDDLATLLAHAADLRQRGARPGPPSLRDAVREAADELTSRTATVPSRTSAIATAITVLDAAADAALPARYRALVD